MDDLAGLDWSKSSNPATPSGASKPSPFSSTSNYSNPSLAAQFRSTPSISPQVTNRSASPAPAAKPAASGNDSFSSLLSIAGRKGTGSPGGANLGSMSLLEQQKRLMEEKKEKEEAQKRQFDMHFGGLDSLGVGGGGGGGYNRSPAVRPMDDDDDLFAAFNADTKVDRSSHFPPPSSGDSSRRGTPALGVERGMSHLGLGGGSNNNSRSNLDALDPFEIGNLPARTPSPLRHESNTNNMDDDDDILGELGKPASAVPPPKPPRPSSNHTSSPSKSSSGRSHHDAKSDPRDPAIAELVGMGFSVSDAKRALAETDTGLDVRQAIDFLLNEAHGKTKSSRKPTSGREQQHRRNSDDLRDENDRRRHQHRDKDREWDRNGEGPRPAWQTGGGAGGDKDITKYATEIGGNLLKSANSLWNTGRKKVAQAINEFQDTEPGHDGVPKWMRDAERAQQGGGGSGQREHRGGDSSRTAEADMLDGDGRPDRGSRRHDDRRRQQEMQERERRKQMEREAELRAQSRRGKISREDADNDAAQAYVSPARRRGAKPAASSPAQPPAPAQNVMEEDLLFGGSSGSSSKPSTPRRPPQPAANNPFSQQKAQPVPPPVVHRPVPTRAIPPVSPSDLSRSHASRAAGSESFKMGDFSTALTHYSAALSPLPSSHPLAYVVLANRAIVNLKLGDARAALADCETVINGVGPSKGEREPVDLGDGNSKDLKEFWSKAVLRRAEALEHMEKWTDAAKAWSVALENGLGGGNASAGKQRCEKALAPKPPPVARPQTTPARKPQRPPVQRAASAATGKMSAEAVAKLRAANAQAEKVDDEKLALYDSVEAKIAGWKGGKEGNLRALLASLDSVLWEGANWKKIGMHELVMANKVKISYMKGIAKVHPDKIPTDATTEQRMISAAVFSALNDAWDEFKKQNNL